MSHARVYRGQAGQNSLARFCRRSVLVSAIVLLPTSSFADDTYIQIEAVSCYTAVSPCNDSTDASYIYGKENADSFVYEMGFQSRYEIADYWYNGSVISTDLYDPNLTNDANDVNGLTGEHNDDHYMDAPHTGIGLWISHGLCDDIASDYASSTQCATDDDCDAEDGQRCETAGSPLPGGDSPVYTRACIYERYRRFKTFAGGGTYSGSTYHDDYVWYGTGGFPGTPYSNTASPSIALGEDSASNGMRSGIPLPNYDTNGSYNAGSNGGVNVQVLFNSCGFRPQLLSKNSSFFFAGVHAVLVAVPTVYIDVADSIIAPVTDSIVGDGLLWGDGRNFGGFAYYLAVNDTSPFYDAWGGPLPFESFESCHTLTGDCHDSDNPDDGAFAVLARDSTDAAAVRHTNTESWSDSRGETYDATGDNYFSYYASCNYDCASDPDGSWEAVDGTHVEGSD